VPSWSAIGRDPRGQDRGKGFIAYGVPPPGP